MKSSGTAKGRTAVKTAGAFRDFVKQIRERVPVGERIPYAKHLGMEFSFACRPDDLGCALNKVYQAADAAVCIASTESLLAELMHRSRR